MGQTHGEMSYNVAERWCGEVARREDARVARRLYRRQEVDGSTGWTKGRSWTIVSTTCRTWGSWRCECKALGGEPVGWQRWRRQLLEQTREKMMVLAQGHDGILHLAEYSLLLGVKLQDVPPEIGGRQQGLAKYGLPAQG
jgi:hypothetical protein